MQFHMTIFPTEKSIIITIVFFSARYRNRVLTRTLMSCKVFTILILAAPIQYFIFLFYFIYYQADFQVERLIVW